MSVPRIYTTRLSVKRGESLQVCAAYDGWLDGKAAFLRPFHVKSLSDVKTPGGFGNPILQESATLQGTDPRLWNSEGAGYN